MTIQLPPLPTLAELLTPANIAFAAFALLWLASMLRCFGHLRLSRLVSRQRAQEAGEPQPVSVVILAENQCHLLRKRLKLFLDQSHPDFEVIVVDMNSRDDTLPYLESLSQYPNLRFRSVPAGARDISPEQLALTLGIRTASHEWVLLTSITCAPASPDWLRLLTAHCTFKRDIVVGYTRFRNPHGWAGLRRCFFMAWQQMLNLTHVSRHYLYRTAPTNLCYRKDFFMSHRGFAPDTTLLTGATDIMVNRHSDRANTALCLHPSATMLQDCPRDGQAWDTERLFFMETRRHLPRHASYRLRYFLSCTLTWLYTLALAASLAFTLLFTPEPHALAIATGVLWLLHTLWRGFSFNSTLRALGEPRLHF